MSEQAKEKEEKFKEWEEFKKDKSWFLACIIVLTTVGYAGYITFGVIDYTLDAVGLRSLNKSLPAKIGIAIIYSTISMTILDAVKRRIAPWKHGFWSSLIGHVLAGIFAFALAHWSIEAIKGWM